MYCLLKHAKQQLILTFAKVKLSINNVNRKLQYKMVKLVMEAELKDKTQFKEKIKRYN